MKRDYRRKVNQLDKEGRLIKTHNSIKEAAKEVIISPEAISNVLNGTNKTAANYKWEYSN